MIRNCKYCREVFKAYSRASRVCDECKEEHMNNNRNRKKTAPYTYVNKIWRKE